MRIGIQIKSTIKGSRFHISETCTSGPGKIPLSAEIAGIIGITVKVIQSPDISICSTLCVVNDVIKLEGHTGNFIRRKVCGRTAIRELVVKFIFRRNKLSRGANIVDVSIGNIIANIVSVIVVLIVIVGDIIGIVVGINGILPVVKVKGNLVYIVFEVISGLGNNIQNTVRYVNYLRIIDCSGIIVVSDVVILDISGGGLTL